MKVACKEEMQRLDQEAMTLYQIPSLLLMEHAAYQVFKRVELCMDEKVVIVCGSGNNGGDGFALARQVVTWSTKQVVVVCMAPSTKLTADANTYYNICEALGVRLLDYTIDKEEAHTVIRHATLIVDALFGTGLTRVITGDYEVVIEAINENTMATVISIDIPSGVECDTGKVLGCAVQADTTVTFEWLKIGLCMYPGIQHAGTVEVVPIGIPSALKKQHPLQLQTIDHHTFKVMLPPRPMRSNKSTFGKLLLIGGSRGMAGAIMLATQAALKVGTGIVRVAVPQTIYQVVEQGIWESMTLACEDDQGTFAEVAIETVKTSLRVSDVVGVGPGMGRTEGGKCLVEEVLKSDKPCVIDADGLYALKAALPLLEQRTAQTILTPHPGEFAYLIDKTIEEVLMDSMALAQAFVNAYQVVLVLKLERTLVVTPHSIYINTVGNTGLAKGGSGDVLTGMIAGFLAATRDAEKAAVLGVYGHGKAADWVAHHKSAYAMNPSDLYEGIEKLFIL